MSVNDRNSTSKEVTWVSYAILIFAVLFFSGIFASGPNWLKAFDYSGLNGTFGKIVTEGSKSISFRGTGGTGARDGFLFCLELIPGIILALGMISVVEGFGGLKVAEKHLTPLLKPLLGIPGICTVALIANLQSTDAPAAMTKELYESGQINDREKTIFAAYQFPASGTIGNYFGSGVALFSFMVVPIIVPLIVIFVFKIVAAHLMRLYITYIEKSGV